MEKMNLNCVVVAPTWVAAINVWWETIHSFFKFPVWIIPQKASELWIKKHEKWDLKYERLDTLIIDEISMVRADMLDCINIFLRKIRWIDTSFWWVKIVLVWDLYQLPPIVETKETEFSKKYDSPYFFSSNVFLSKENNFKTIILEKIYRQTDDLFVNILNNIREWKYTNQDLDELNKSINNNFTDKQVIT